MKFLSPVIVALCACAGLPQPFVHAEEGGSGHYLPGAIASFIDGTATDPAFVARVNVISYDGSISTSLPIAGLEPANVDASSFAGGLTLLWRPEAEPGTGWSYAMSATIPYVWLDVSADVTAGETTVRLSSSISGLGDIVLMPLMVNYAASADVHLDFRLGIYAPTGSYQVGRLANTGKNFWTIEPTLGLLYLGQKNGREASLYAGMDFNSENEDTQYTSGSQFHLDGTLAQHFPFKGGLAGIGVSGYWYNQVSGDSGAGATFGDFKGRTMGIGPAVSFVGKAGKADLIAELKWLTELETRNRLEGDYVWLKVVFKF